MNKSVNEQRLYKDLAWTWPIISPPGDYVEETEHFSQLIREHARIEVKTLLNLGSGGGHNDATLKKFFKVTGVDISDAMLDLARRLNPEVKYLKGDIRRLKTIKKFDAVTIFDSIDYMLAEEDLRAVFSTAFKHLKPGGVLLTLAGITPERFKQNQTSIITRTADDMELTFTENHFDPDPTDSTFEVTLIYLIRRSGKLRIETDRHLCGIFELKTWLDLLNETGYEVALTDYTSPDPDIGTIPVFICLKPT